MTREATPQADFDAIIIGSGITGGWAAKELTGRGLKVAMIERGRPVIHGEDYGAETLAPWDYEWRGLGDPGIDPAGMSRIPLGIAGLTGVSERVQTPGVAPFLVDPRDFPYQTEGDQPFHWTRGYQLGGKSLAWGRKSFRWSDLDFGANARDGHGVDWPIRYADVAPWYDMVERFIGVAGSSEGLPQLPDGEFLPAIPLNAVEQAFKEKIEEQFPGRKLIPSRVANLTQDRPEQGRTRCQSRNICARGCSFGAYFSSLSGTLPVAEATGRLTTLTNSRAVRIDHDPATGRATGVRVLDTLTRATRTLTARTIFVCAGSFNSVGLLMNSTSEAHPRGIGNGHDMLGRYLMDHAGGVQVQAMVPGYLDRNYEGFRPTNNIIPRFKNLDGADRELLRGYCIAFDAARLGWEAAAFGPGVGAAYKRRARERGPWRLRFNVFAEVLPDAQNRLTLDPVLRDEDGQPQFRIKLDFGANERALVADAIEESVRMAEAFGAIVTQRPGLNPRLSGTIHEMGGARMGHDPRTSVLNGFNQVHDMLNVFVTDGACMASSAWQNPSLTYMALTARATAHAVDRLQSGTL
jgi:choline dehydrogenase-like flavoprotein